MVGNFCCKLLIIHVFCVSLRLNFVFEKQDSNKNVFSSFLTTVLEGKGNERLFSYVFPMFSFRKSSDIATLSIVHSSAKNFLLIRSLT